MPVIQIPPFNPIAPPSGSYEYLTFVDARTALANRLADPGKVFWVEDELGKYLIEALRTWNALTAQWNADFDLSAKIVPGQIWYDLTSLPNYPRLRTVLDADLYSVILYHLLEQQSPANLTGQFQQSDVYAALQRRRDQIILMTGCSLANIQIPAKPGIRRNLFPGTALYPIRNRFVPDDQNQSAVTLWREDSLSSQYFESGYLQKAAGTPQIYGVINGTPLTFDVDVPPALAGLYDVVMLQSGLAFAPPAKTLIGIPDDFSWVNKWGALADVLNIDSEVTDTARADYCLQRYRDGIAILNSAPWILTATVNGEPVDTISAGEMDAYSVEWDSNPSALNCLVCAGMDFIAPCPVPAIAGAGVSMTVVGNAPVPNKDGDFVQVSRDTIDVILDYAQHLAAFKMGGAEFGQTKELAKNFFSAAQDRNARLKALGLFRDLMLGEGERQDEMQPRKEQEEE